MDPPVRPPRAGAGAGGRKGWAPWARAAAPGSGGLRVHWGRAEEAGFDAERLEHAFAVVGSACGGEAIPGAVVAVGRRGVGLGPRAYGWAVRAPEAERRATEPGTLFDLASLTKVVGTASAAWLLLERGLLRLEDRLALLLPAFAGEQEGEGPGWRAAVTIRHLLTHTSGLPAGRNLRAVAGDRAARLAAVAATPLQAAPGERCVYSDLGFILLGCALEGVAGTDLPTLCQAGLFSPLGMAETTWTPPAALADRAAATEWAEGEWAPGGRAGYVRGTVHDENARALGGVAGHAGLFSTAADLAVFADALRAGGAGGAPGGPVRRILSRATVARLGEPLVVTDHDSRTLGWQGPGTLSAPCGDLWSRRAFGHTGFTGTSLWVDPERDFWAVLLTNAVHLGRAVGGPAVQRLRACFHNAALAAIE